MNPELHGNESLFYDTYALYAIAKGVDSYQQFTKHHMLTTFLNIYELYFVLLRENQATLAEEFMHNLWGACVEITPEMIRKASRIRHSNAGLSYADALGYAISLAQNVKFLTGDSAFKDKQNVLFVK